MDFTRLSLPFSMLLLSMIVIAFAGDYGNDPSKYGYNGVPADSPLPKPEYGSNPNGENKPNYGEKPGIYNQKSVEKPNYGTKPDIYKPKPEVKPDYDRKPESEEKPNYDNYNPKGEEKEQSGYEKKPYDVKYKPQGEEKPNYGTKPDINKPKPEEKSDYHRKPDYGNNYKPKEEEKEQPGYGSKPYVVKSKPVGEAKTNYGTKPENYKSKPKEESGYSRKPEGEEKPNYATNQYSYNQKPEEKEKPDYEKKPYVAKPKPEEKPYSVAVEGIVLCKSGSTYYPIQGAFAKVTCQAVDKLGLEKTLPICSVTTDAKGYFYATLSSLNESLKLKDCRAFLESSPVETCKVPTDVNEGITGAPVSGDHYRVLNDKHTKLYSAGPFFFTSEPKPVSNGY